jgi:hypothetical protein
MNCRKVRRYLFGYFRQELSPEERERVKAHLDNCAKCAKEAKEIERINLLLKDDLETFVPSVDFNKKLLAKIQTLSSEVTVRDTRNWWVRLLHEVFPSVRLRWALAGAVSVIIVAWAVMFSQRQTSIRQEYLSQNDTERENQTLVSSQDIADSLHQEMLNRVAQTSIIRNKAFIIDNFSFSASKGEDGRIRPEDLYKRFVIERRSPLTRQRGRGNHYVLPVVSTQQVSQKIDY